MAEIKKIKVGETTYDIHDTTYAFTTGDAKGQIKVTPSGGTAYNVDVKGLGSSAYETTYKAAECTTFTSDSGNCTPAAVQKAAKQFAYAGPLTGYAKASSAVAVAATDTIVSAIGKLEKALDGKSGTGHTHSYAASATAGGPATNISVTDQIPNGTTRYCLYSDGVSGGQAAKACADLYYTGGTGWTSFNIGKGSGNGIVTLHKGNYYGNLQVTTLTENRNYTFPNASGTISLDDHTHKYAGSSSAGGAATSANKVNQSITFNNGGAGVASGTTFDGSTARTVSYNTIGAVPQTWMYVDDAATTYVAPSGGGADVIAIGSSATADGADSVVIGKNAYTGSDYTVVIGTGASVSDSESIAIGYETRSQGIAIGAGAIAGSGSIVIGDSLNTDASAVSIGIGNTKAATGAVIVGISNTGSSQSAVSVGRGNFVTSGVSFGRSNNAYSSAIAIGTTCYADYSSVAIGSSCKCTGSNATSCVAIGSSATAAFTGSVAIGSKVSSCGGSSVAMGLSCTADKSTNVAIGYLCTTSASGSVAIGRSCTASDYNSVAVGASCNSKAGVAMGYSNKSYGSYSTAIGTSCTAGSSSYPATATASYGAYAIAIGYNVTATGTGSKSYVKIGTSNNYYYMNGTSWTSGSDERDKTNIQPLHGGLSLIKNIQPILFQYNYRTAYSDSNSILDYDIEEHQKGTKADDELVAGFSAQEVAKYFDSNYGDECFNHIIDVNREVNDETGEQDFAYTLGDTRLIPFMFQAIKEQQDIIEEQNERINKLELQLAEILNKLNK